GSVENQDPQGVPGWPGSLDDGIRLDAMSVGFQLRREMDSQNRLAGPGLTGHDIDTSAALESDEQPTIQALHGRGNIDVPRKRADEGRSQIAARGLIGTQEHCGIELRRRTSARPTKRAAPRCPPRTLDVAAPCPIFPSGARLHRLHRPHLSRNAREKLS